MSDNGKKYYYCKQGLTIKYWEDENLDMSVPNPFADGCIFADNDENAVDILSYHAPDCKVVKL